MTRKHTLIAATLFTGALTLSSAYSSPVPSATPKPVVDTTAADRLFKKKLDASLRPGDFDVDPRNRSDEINNLGIDRAVDRLTNPPVTTAGMATRDYKSSGKDYKESKQVATPECKWFCNPSLFSEYEFINSDDERKFGSDSRTHSISVGGDFSTIGDLLVGVIYSYSDRDADSDFLHSTTSSDSHFGSVYMAKSFWNFLNVGVSGAFGHTYIESSLHGTRGRTTLSDVDTVSGAPFLGVSHRWGALSGSLTTTYLYNVSYTSAPNGNRDDETGKINVNGKIGYAVTEKLKISAFAKYTWVVDHESASPDLSEDYQWATFGTKISYQICQPLELYVGYEADVWNKSYENHTGRGGLTYSF